MLLPEESCAGPSSTSSLSCWECWVSSGVTSDVASALRLSAWLVQPSGLDSRHVSPVPEWAGHSQSSKRSPCTKAALMAARSWRRGKDSLSSELELGGCHSSVTSPSTCQEDTSPGVKECCREHWGCLSPLCISRRGEPAPEHSAAPALLEISLPGSSWVFWYCRIAPVSVLCLVGGEMGLHVSLSLNPQSCCGAACYSPVFNSS